MSSLINKPTLSHLPDPPAGTAYRFQEFPSGHFCTTGAFPPSAPNRKAESLAWAGVMLADFDLCDYIKGEGEGKESAKSRLYAMDQSVRETLFAEFLAAIRDLTSFLPPTVLVRSGWGIHAYWWLAEGVDPQQFPKEYLTLKAANRALVAALHRGSLKADHVFDTGTRILRTPGTWNTKSDPPILCSVIEGPWDDRVTWEQVVKLAPVKEEEPLREGADTGMFSEVVESVWDKNPRLEPYFQGQGRKKGDLSASGYEFALALELAKMGIEEDDIADVLETRDPNRPAGTLRTTAENAVKLAKERATFLPEPRVLAKLRGFAGGTVPVLEIDNILTIFRYDPRLAGIATGSAWSPELVWSGKCLEVLGRKAGVVVDGFTPLVAWVASVYGLSGNRLETLIVAALREITCSVDPVTDMLKALVWDRTARLDSDETYAALGMGAEQIASLNSAQRVYLRLWFVQAVKRAMEPGCFAKHALYLWGPQSSGKSGLVRVIGSGFSSDSQLDFSGDVETLRTLRRNWIWEIAETGNAGARSSQQIKHFISAQTDEIRDPYERAARSWPRRQCFAMTSNHEAFLNDDSGAIRFMPLNVKHVDFPWWKANIAQLWAEAFSLYQSGGTAWDFTPEQLRVHAKHAAQSLTEGSALEDKIQAHSWGKQELWTIAEVMEELKLPESAITSMQIQRQVSSGLRRLGWAQKHTMKGNRWVSPPVDTDGPAY